MSHTPNAQIKRLLKDIKKYPILSKEEEKAILERAKKGDLRAEHELIASNIRFVIAVAKVYQGQGVPLSDLIAEGYLGLVKAASRFESGSETKFLSYAVHQIRKYIRECIARMDSLGAVPPWYKVNAAKIKKSVATLGPTWRVDEIVEDTGLPQAKVVDVLKRLAPPLSISAPRFLNDAEGTGDKCDVGGGIKARWGDPRKGHSEARLAKSIADLLGPLSSRERQVVELRLGLNGAEPMRYRDIGPIICKSHERARQIYNVAMGKVKMMDSKTKKFRDSFMYAEEVKAEEPSYI